MRRAFWIYLPVISFAAFLLALRLLGGPSDDQTLIDIAADVIEAPAQAHALMTAQARAK